MFLMRTYGSSCSDEDKLTVEVRVCDPTNPEMHYSFGQSYFLFNKKKNGHAIGLNGFLELHFISQNGGHPFKNVEITRFIFCMYIAVYNAYFKIALHTCCCHNNA